MTDLNIDAKFGKQGQIRRFGDSHYEVTLTVTGEKQLMFQATGVRLAAVLLRIGAWKLKDDPTREWHETYLDTERRVDDKTLFVRFVKPSTH